MQDRIKKMKKEIKPGLLKYMEKKDPGKSMSTYTTYVSDSNYLINNDKEDEYIRFVHSDEDSDEIRELIKSLLIEHRGEDKVKDGEEYYYEKLCWQREYIQSIGGIDELLGIYSDLETKTAFIITAEYDDKVQEIAEKLLKHIIDTNQTIFYSELSKRLSFEINPRNIERQLGVISYACKSNGLPPISVMVVNKETLMPGNGFYNAYCSELKSDKERWKRCFELTKQVQEYKGWDAVLSAFQKWK